MLCRGKTASLFADASVDISKHSSRSRKCFTGPELGPADPDLPLPERSMQADGMRLLPA